MMTLHLVYCGVDKDCRRSSGVIVSASGLAYQLKIAVLNTGDPPQFWRRRRTADTTVWLGSPSEEGLHLILIRVGFPRLMSSLR